MLSTKSLLGLAGDVGKLGAIRAGIRHLVRDDQMMLRIHGDLNVVADNAGATPACSHRAGIRVRQRNLLIGRSQHLFLKPLQTLLLGRELG